MQIKYHTLTTIDATAEVGKSHRNDPESNEILNQEKKLNLNSLTNLLTTKFENIYLIDVLVFIAYENETIVEIAILEKTAVDPDLSKPTRDIPISLHPKVPIPPYQGIENKSKFDINWQWDL